MRRGPNLARGPGFADVCSLRRCAVDDRVRGQRALRCLEAGRRRDIHPACVVGAAAAAAAAARVGRRIATDPDRNTSFTDTLHRNYVGIG